MAETVKKRNWGFILYTESAPKNWIEILKESGLPCAISPLHDKDLDSEGNLKKAHHHVIVCYSGPTSFKIVKTLTDSLNQPIPISLHSIKGTYRYHVHLDDVDKYQYHDDDRIFLNGFNIKDYVDTSKSDIHRMKIEIQNIIRNNDIFEFWQLLDFLLDNEFFELHEVACNNTVLFDRYISSKRYQSNKKK